MPSSETTPDRLPPRPSPTSAMGDANVLRSYAGVLRRRWAWVLLGLVVGLLGGAASTFLVKEERDPNKYYKATNTLVVNGAGQSGTNVGNTVNIQQSAFLIRSAEVTDKVAAQVGMTSQAVNDQISATGRADVLAIDVTAVSTNPDEAVRLADTGAAVLTEYVGKNDQKQFAAQTEAVQKKLDDIKAQQADLRARVATNPPEIELLNAELDSLVNQYRLTYEQFQALAAQGGPVSAYSTLQSATPVQINGAAFQSRLATNRNARGATSASPSTPTTPDVLLDETNLAVGPPVSKTMRVIIGGAAGLVMGLAMAFLVEAWDDRIRKRDRIEALTGLPVIAEVPRLVRELKGNAEIAAVDAPRSRAAERYRSVRTAVLFALHEHLGVDSPGVMWADGVAPVVMITSPNPSEGKTTTVANLAAVFGASGMKTLVVDCDYRKPAIAPYLNPVPDFDTPDNPSYTRLPNVSFIPAPRGGGRPAEMVQLLRENIATWRQSVDMVILDTPPMLTTNDATDLLAAADAVLLVLRAGQTRSGAAERVANILHRYRAEVLGIVLNSCDDAEMDAYYGYYRGYGEEDAPSRRKSSASSTVGLEAEAAVDERVGEQLPPRAKG